MSAFDLIAAIIASGRRRRRPPRPSRWALYIPDRDRGDEDDAEEPDCVWMRL